MKGKKNNNQKKKNTTKKVTVTKKETNKKQNFLVIVLILIILMCAFFSIKTIVNSNKKDNPKEKELVNEEILKDAQVGDLTITNVRLVASDNITTFMAKISNETETDYHVNVLYVTFTTGNITRKIPILTDMTIKAHDHKPISLTLDSDITDTTQIDYEVK